MSLSGSDLDKIKDVVEPIVVAANTAEVQIITAPGLTVTVSQADKSHTTQADDIGVAAFKLSLGFWDVVAETNYKIMVEQLGRSYTFTSTDKLKLEDCSWGLIDLLGRKGLATQYFSIGDTKDIVIAGEKITCLISGHEHDEMENSDKAPLSFVFQQKLMSNKRMNATAINSTSWRDSEMRMVTLPSIIEAIPEDLKAVVKAVAKKTATSNSNANIITTYDKFWLLSEQEVSGENLYSHVGEGTKYPIFTDNVSRQRKSNGSGDVWFLRSPHIGDIKKFRVVDNFGGVDSDSPGYGTANNARGIVFGFCV